MNDKVPRLASEDLYHITPRAVHCSNPECGRFLCYEGINIGIIQQKCRRCKTWTQVSNVTGDDTAPTEMREVRCPACGRFLYLEALVEGFVKSKCRGCHTWHTLDIFEQDAKIGLKVEKSIRPPVRCKEGRVRLRNYRSQHLYL